MVGSDIVMILICAVLAIVLIAAAWWIAGIQTLLERLAVGLEMRHIERNAERAAERRRLDARQMHFFQWLAETASTLKGLHRLAKKCSERQDKMVMTSSPPLQAEPASEPEPSTVKPSRQPDAALPDAEPTEDRPSDSDVDTLCWKGPDSGHTLLGVGATALNAPPHGSAPARELAQQVKKVGR